MFNFWAPEGGPKLRLGLFCFSTADTDFVRASRPQVRQYFHKGLLWRSAQSGEVASFELFCDLLYVGVIDVIGEVAVEAPSGLSLLHFVIAFSIGWKIWADLTNVVNWFVIDDIFQRLCVLFYLVCSPYRGDGLSFTLEYSH